ncbi:hypothetical protein [Paractinoplanes hotanensis]|jgi:hypothetical protein|uniref:DUF2613 domain-containing protein n=1 Tax=Paractinoplanes hotanensis TaxID=2906497 RepID=A0ABT0Y9M1_9ACTN|nr:hypothetical protein [Actinoplanes hotanensis]MCM4082747.1 hypothetical protein [Actinoplanes hotanensis]
MAKLATYVVALVAGGVLGAVGIMAMMGAVNPSADHVAQTTDIVDASTSVYGTR